MKIARVLFFLALLSWSIIPAHGQEIAPDGAWCWFSDPRAVYYQGEQERIYYGYINTAGDVMIGSRDLATKMTEAAALHKDLQIDDHNVPSILFLPDGRILTFYTEHNGRFFMRKSLYPEDITAWDEERELRFGTSDILITYSHPVMLRGENNRIYLFFRGRNKHMEDNPNYSDWRQYYTYSDDEGETWSAAQAYLSSRGNYDKIPYLKLVSDDTSRIHFLFTDGHPKLGLSSVYHMYYEEGQFYQSNGEVIQSIAEGPVPPEKVHKVYDADSAGIKSWIWDIALDSSGKPVIAYAQYPSIQDHIYHYARWDGRKWTDRQIVHSGGYITEPEQSGKVLEEHYSGGVVLDHQHPDHIYLARQVDGTFEIEHWLLKNGKWTSTALTRNSKADNIRPCVVADFPGKHPPVLWMNGTYEHYVRFNTRLMIHE